MVGTNLLASIKVLDKWFDICSDIEKHNTIVLGLTILPSLSSIQNHSSQYKTLININCKYVPMRDVRGIVLFADFIPSVIVKSPKKEDNN